MNSVDNQPIAVVTPWFGRDLKGGAEQQAWQIATRLAARGHRVEVLTTCCRSFSDDWAENHLSSGAAVDAGITIRRFPVDARNRAAFDQLNIELLGIERHRLLPGVAAVRIEHAAIWAAENINSIALEDYLKSNGGGYRRFIFLPYLYGIVLRGLPLVSDRAWLQPCLHDEAYAYLPDVAALFHSAAGLLFNSHGELRLAAKLFGPMALSKGNVVGEGVELDLEEAARNPGHLPPEVGGRRFVFCLGRRCQEKGTDRLVAAFQEFRRRNSDGDLWLVLAGPGNKSYGIIESGVIDVGLVDESQKIALLRNCLALLQPSANESFSRVLFEAWICGRPAVVHRDCLATASAVEDSNGGWIAASDEDWICRLEALSACTDPELQAIGMQGNRFARKWANWDSVLSRYATLLDLDGTQAISGVVSRERTDAIHQLLPNLSYGDAISNQAMWIREQLLLRGYRSEIFVRHLDERLRDRCRPYEPGVLSAADSLLYHHSIGSEITPVALSHSGPKWLIYHNITPPEFFRPYGEEHARLLRQGREEMFRLARAFRHSAGVSCYNAEELQMYGFTSPQVLPLAIDPASWSASPDKTLMRDLQDGRRNLLFVGRIAPNKCQHDLVDAFAHYLMIDPEARLILVGSGEPDEPYVKFVKNLVQRHALGEHVVFAGRIGISELHAYYRTAHLYWSMSEHEGFCVPLVEAMWFDVPILAFQASAIGETLGGAGIAFDRKDDLGVIAALAERMTNRRQLFEPVLRAQRERRNAFIPAVVGKSLLHLIQKLDCQKLAASF